MIAHKLSPSDQEKLNPFNARVKSNKEAGQSPESLPAHHTSMEVNSQSSDKATISKAPSIETSSTCSEPIPADNEALEAAGGGTSSKIVKENPQESMNISFHHSNVFTIFTEPDVQIS